MASPLCPKPAFGRLNRGHPLAQGLCLCLPLHEAGGSTLYDVGGGEQHGAMTSFGASPWGGSLYGWSLAFDGAATYVQGTKVTSTFGSGKFSVAVLFKAGSTGAVQPLFVKEDNITRAINTYVQASGVLRFELYDGSNNPTLDTGSTWNDGQWHLAVWTRNGSALKCYVDGVLANGNTSTVNDCSLATALYRLGRRTWSGGSGTYLSGGMAGVWAWEGVELTADQVARHYADPFGMLRRRSLTLKRAGTLFTKSLLATSAAAAVAVKQPSRTLSTASPASAAVLALRTLRRAVSAASVSAATVVKLKVNLKTVSATSASNAAVSRQAWKSTAAASSAAAAVTKRAGGIRAATSAAQGLVAGVRSRFFTLSATISAQGTVAALQSRLLTALGASTGAAATKRSVSKNAAGMSAASGSASRSVARTVTGSSPAIGSVARLLPYACAAACAALGYSQRLAVCVLAAVSPTAAAFLTSLTARLAPTISRLRTRFGGSALSGSAAASRLSGQPGAAELRHQAGTNGLRSRNITKD